MNLCIVFVGSTLGGLWVWFSCAPLTIRVFYSCGKPLLSCSSPMFNFSCCSTCTHFRHALLELRLVTKLFAGWCVPEMLAVVWTVSDTSWGLRFMVCFAFSLRFSNQCHVLGPWSDSLENNITWSEQRSQQPWDPGDWLWSRHTSSTGRWSLCTLHCSLEGCFNSSLWFKQAELQNRRGFARDNL